MASKGLRMKTLKKTAVKIDHSSPLRTNVPAGLAAPNPPLGPMLGQRNINITAFCLEFNRRTEQYKQGIPLPVRVKVLPDNKFDLTIHKPPTTFYLKQAAGIAKGKFIADEVAGKITLKHIYEIALIKSEDPPLALMSLAQICQMIINTAYSCGIKVVRELNPEEHAQFMKTRDEAYDAFREELKAANEAKLLRVKA